MNTIILGNCLDKLKDIPDNSIDSIVTDPPYHLVSIVKRFGKEGSAPAQFGTDGAFSRASKGFMGKTWDGLDENGNGIAHNVDMWKECLRVLKPGGHLISFAGTRTYHRMACAIEDAGFEVRDMISWIYGSGFPKSLNIGKAVDKLQGNEREVVGEKMGGTPQTGLYEAGLGVNEGKYIKETKGNSPWEGWGTALKPACEPCVLARKPLSEKTVAENILKWGTGGINIDGSRVSGEMGKDRALSTPRRTDNDKYGKANETINPQSPLGRFPANLIHDGSDEVLELFPNTKSGGRNIKSSHTHWGTGEISADISHLDSSGSAARFFYCAKTSKAERNRGCEELEEKPIDNQFNSKKKLQPDGELHDNIHLPRQNNHPTVKPQALMKYLIKLITPPGGVVLDMFAGSGSTLVAAKELGHPYIGIEMTEEYIPIIKARLGL